MDRICTFGDGVDIDVYGGKAYWLNWLYKRNIPVPESFFIPAQKASVWKNIKEDIRYKAEIQDILKKYLRNDREFAVRSSAVKEDRFMDSKAGMYQSFLHVSNVDGIIDSIYKMNHKLEADDRLGIIVQQMVLASVSGVLFSSNPVNGKKSEPFLCMVEGIGDKLMAGLEKGEELQLKIEEGKIEIPQFESLISKDELERLIQIAKKIEKDLQYPVDIEWCIEENSRMIVILQCRPMTGIMVKKNEIVPVTIEAMKNLPGYLRTSNKVWIRELAEKKGIMISKAYLLVCNCGLAEVDKIDFNYAKSKYHSGYSVVLISPSHIGGKVQRFFVGEKNRVYSATKCHRFGIREFANYNQVEKCLSDLVGVAQKEQWVCSAIVQEILDAKYTGIVKKITDGFLIETVKGHFASKGIIPMSAYVTDFSGRILYKKEVNQNKYISIIEGCALEYRTIESEKTSIPDECVRDIVNCFSELLISEQVIVEFGVLNNSYLTPYLIDYMQEEDSELSLKAIRQGVISDGKVEGELIKLDIGDAKEVLDIHFHNTIVVGEREEEKSRIFFAKSPSIQLVDILTQCNPGKIGFVFEEGSTLCHFSVLLRERGIPAIRGIMSNTLQEGEIYQLDTMNQGLIMKGGNQF